MLTFLDLYQTLMGFVLFKLYLDLGLTYPPSLDLQREQEGAGLGAFSLKEIAPAVIEQSSLTQIPVTPGGKRITGRVVREVIKGLGEGQPQGPQDVAIENSVSVSLEEDFVPQVTQSTQPATLPTFQTLTSSATQSTPVLFDNMTFFLSRETPRTSFEFMVKALGGKIGWSASQGSSSPFQEENDAITHVIIDRPIRTDVVESEAERLRRFNRKYIQPQWIVDCINAGKLLPEDLYSQGRTLPPHLSPFGEGSSTYIPSNEGVLTGPQGEARADDSEADSELADDEDLEAAVDDPNMIQAAEIRAELAGVDAKTFDQKLEKVTKRQSRGQANQQAVDQEQDMNKMLMTNKERKLYDKLKFTERKREGEVSNLKNRVCSHLTELIVAHIVGTKATTLGEIFETKPSLEPVISCWICI
jgi:pescadillo protein